MRPRAYGEVVGAMLRLRCTPVRETDEHIALSRFPKIYLVVRGDPGELISVQQQERIFSALGFTRDEYIDAVRGIN